MQGNNLFPCILIEKSMKTLLIVILCFLNLHFIYSQNIKLNQINSSNILDYYDRLQMIKSSQDFKNTDVSTQIGIGNMIEVIDKSPNYIELMQAGNYNTTYFVNPNNYPTNAQINVNGSGNYIDITGSNSISDGMIININANDMTIFMRNY